MKKVIAVCILATILVVAHAGSDVKKENLLQIFQDMSESTLFEEFMSSSTNSTCPKPGHCGLAYQSCCAGYIASGFPCDCHLQPGTVRNHLRFICPPSHTIYNFVSGEIFTQYILPSLP